MENSLSFRKQRVISHLPAARVAAGFANAIVAKQLLPLQITSKAVATIVAGHVGQSRLSKGGSAMDALRNLHAQYEDEE